ncbi:MAG: SGNH/GDSL hydrolase family protein [Nannocystaceae bacterium]
MSSVLPPPHALAPLRTAGVRSRAPRASSSSSSSSSWWPPVVLGSLLGAPGCSVSVEITGVTDGSAASSGSSASTTGAEETGTGETEDPSASGSTSTGGSGGSAGTWTSGDPFGGIDPGPRPELYPDTRTLSPLTENVAGVLQSIVAAHPREDRVFAKIGASATASVSFLRCFAGDDVDLAGRDELWSTIDHFAVDLGGGVTSFDRESLCAVPGWSAGKALAGDPSPLDQELAAIDPRFAVVMYGTNDINLNNVHAYGEHLLNLTDHLIASGVVPLMTSVMPRDDNPAADAMVPAYNAVVRAVAQSRQIPFIDFHRELVELADHGLGGDGIHRSTFSGGACVLTPEGLEHGYNIRNLITLQSLDRARRVALDGVPELDPSVHVLAGAGTHEAPYVIPFLPFGDRRDTEVDGEAAIDLYDGCDADQDESGREVYYRLHVEETRTVRALVVDRGDVDIDLHLLDASATGAGCLARHDRTLVVTLDPGDYVFTLDTFASGGEPLAGEYLFVVVDEPDAP